MTRFYERAEGMVLEPHRRILRAGLLRERTGYFYPGRHSPYERKRRWLRELGRYRTEEHATQFWMTDGRFYRSDHWNLRA